jgi:serine/threonine protein kinase
VPAQISKTAELIAGYTLQDRIGSGGYGEVWKAEAPGGLLKAIKFIYGRFDEERASCELKALHRIKEVRHPFLLSLERIEVIEGQLVIVTELAEASLNDRFDACRAANLPGIPRHELLIYLHDAADALDYMSAQFSLQHLDIKPENMLMVGGRVKVADFGLVKDIQEATVSLLGGMTPVYAAPEVFDGHPSLQSDQYSLAIVYQEMLSGVLPFPGKTPAQLTSQHLHGRPRLTPLPAGDRPIVARALSKDPNQRFDNCRALIEALQAAENAPAEATSPDGPRRSSLSSSARQIYRTVTLSVSESSNDTESKRLNEPEESEEAIDESAEPREKINSWEKTASVAAISEALAQAKAEQLAQLHAEQQEPEVDYAPEPLPPPAFHNLPSHEEPFTNAELRPTFVLGAGGTAARVLLQLQQLWQDRFGNLEDVPIFQSLLLDTDPKYIDKIVSARGTADRLIETELLTLQKPEDYREQADQLFHWLGRRWLYNIPRSLRTEGLRPLGRLAFVDHARKVTEKIRKALKTIADPASIETASRKTLKPIADSSPLIYLVASISGGTGSGMILDLAYAVRKVLADEGIANARICGILLHGTSRHANPRKLAIANSYACLRELYAYARKYPGEAACDIPATEESQGPFDDAYFVDFGDDLGDDELSAATAKIADYVDLDATTACRGFFNECRTSASGGSPSPPGVTLRTLGLSRLGFTPDDIPAADIELLCRNLLEHWSVPPKTLAARNPSPSGTPAPGKEKEPKTPAKTESVPLSAAAKKILDFDFLGNQIEELVHDQINSSDETALQETLDKTLKFESPLKASGETVARVQQTLDVLFASVQSLFDNNRASAEVANEAIIQPLRTLATAEGSAIGTRIFEQLEGSEGGLASLMETIDEVLRELHQRECDACSRQERLREIISQAEALLASEVASQKKNWFQRLFGNDDRSHLDQCWNDYSRWRLELVILHGQRYLWHGLFASLISLHDQLRDLRQELLAVSQEFRLPDQAAPPNETGSWAFQNLLKPTWDSMLRKHRQAIVARLDKSLRGKALHELLGESGNGKSQQILSKNAADSLRQSVRQELNGLLREIDLTGLLLNAGPASADAPSPLKMLLDQAHPRLYDACGGAQRLLLICPKEAETDAFKQKIEKDIAISPSVAHTSNHELLFCYEVEQVPARLVAEYLMKDQSDCREIAEKLHTRVDVRWPRDF